MANSIKPQTYVNFAHGKVWFVGYAKDRPYEDNSAREVVIVFRSGKLSVVKEDQLEEWMGPRSAAEWLNDIFNWCNERINTKGLVAVGLSEIEKVRDMAACGLGLNE